MISKCGVKLADKNLTIDLMQMLALDETIDQLAKANSAHWYEHVLRKDKNNFLRRALHLKVKWTRKKCRPTKTLIKAVVKQSIHSFHFKNFISAVCVCNTV